MKRLMFWLFAAAAIQGVSACAHRGDTSPQQASEQIAAASTEALTAYHWQLEQAGSPATEPVQLTFSDNRLAVQGLCNALGAAYTLDGPTMTIKSSERCGCATTQP